MSRHRPETRLEYLIQAGGKVFLEKGYRRAQVSDIAQAMGVAPGTIYLYVESKEALFDIVIRASVSPEILKGLALPVPTPAPHATLSFIQAALEQESRIETLEAALKRRRATDIRTELGGIASELYSKASRRWFALKMMERSALDWPELAQLWFGQHRLRLLQQLTRYFEVRTATGALRKAPDAPVAARLVLEMIAAFAMHCRMDPSPQLDQVIAEAVVIDAIVHAYLPKAKPESRVRRKGH